ncbi:MAG: FAD-dependent oxidoreductase [Rickettsiales bacterium]
MSYQLSEQGKSKMVVVGAGLAGLTAAYRLYQNGYEVEVYEARPRASGGECIRPI